MYICAFIVCFSFSRSWHGTHLAAQAKERKWSKYLHLATNHIFNPVAIETSGALHVGPESKNFIRELGHKLEQVTGFSNSLHYLLQVFIAVQWGISAFILGSSGLAYFDDSCVFIN